MDMPVRSATMVWKLSRDSRLHDWGGETCAYAWKRIQASDGNRGAAAQHQQQPSPCCSVTRSARRPQPRCFWQSHAFPLLQGMHPLPRCCSPALADLCLVGGVLGVPAAGGGQGGGWESLSVRHGPPRSAAGARSTHATLPCRSAGSPPMVPCCVDIHNLPAARAACAARTPGSPAGCAG